MKEWMGRGEQICVDAVGYYLFLDLIGSGEDSKSVGWDDGGDNRWRDDYISWLTVIWVSFASIFPIIVDRC